MGIEVLQDEIIIQPAAFDPHCHPRALDALVESHDTDEPGFDGKAGVYEYTRSMAISGFAGGLAMPNESIRTGRLDGGRDEQGYASESHPHPINTVERVHEMEQRIGTEANVNMGILFGEDPKELYDPRSGVFNRDLLRQRYAEVKGRVVGSKTYAEETEGGYAIRVEDVPDAIEDWQIDHAGEPKVLHLEGVNIARVLEEVGRRKGGKDWAIHIAHLSSRVELEAVIRAKVSAMNVTGEATSHHLSMTEDDQLLLGGQGCMKPSLKTREDLEFLWANIKHIDMFGSDCAPHRKNDKLGSKASFGVTNHPMAIPLLITEMLKKDSRISRDKLYDMLVVAPRHRFNLPLDDDSMASFERGRFLPSDVEAHTQYFESPFKTYVSRELPDAEKRFTVAARCSRLSVKDTVFVRQAGTDTEPERVALNTGRGFYRILRPLGATAKIK